MGLKGEKSEKFLICQICPKWSAFLHSGFSESGNPNEKFIFQNSVCKVEKSGNFQISQRCLKWFAFYTRWFRVGKLENEVDISKFVGKVESLKIFEFPKNVKT